MKWLVLTLSIFTIQGFSQHHFKPSKEVADKLKARTEKKESDKRAYEEALRRKLYKFDDKELLIISGCNTAKNSSYHTQNEQEFILLMNLARTNEGVLHSYIAHTYDTSFVNQLPPIPKSDKRLILDPSFGLHLSAKVHAKKSGRKGTIGHQNMDRRVRMFNFYFKSQPIYGENCSYNDTVHPLVHFIQLMNSPGHFSNIMRVDYNVAGVSFKKHIKYGMNGVTCFGFK